MAFSFLFPAGMDEAYIDTCSTDLIRDLDLAYYLNPKKISCETLLTCNAAVIHYRECLFDDVLHIPELNSIIKDAVHQLEVISELRRIRNVESDNEGRLYAIKEIEIYVDFMTTLYDRFSVLHDQLHSEQFIHFWNKIKDIYESNYFCSLKEGVEQLTFSVKNIHSLTIGVNLDASLSPYEAGILSINPESFHSGDIVSRFMRMEKKDDMMTLTPLAVMSGNLSEKDQQILRQAVNSGLNKIVSSSFKSWRNMIKQYFNDKNILFFLLLLHELKFIRYCMDFIGCLQVLNLPICIPKVCPMEEKCFTANRIYNPVVAIKNADINKKTIYNDISFSSGGELLIMTGPNRGGKSVFLNAVGITQFMFQLGLPVPAASAALSPVSGIYTHYPRTGETFDKGRFGEECARLQEILQKIDEFSMVLFDETLSGTGAYEASLIGKEVITAMAVIGTRGIFATHLHDLANKKDEINSEENLKSKIDNLIVGVEEGERTYKIHRGVPDGKSYARDISGKYGLSVEMILSENKKFHQ